MIQFSIVSPVHRAENTVAILVSKIIEHVAPMGSYEIILVEDGSKDKSWEAIEKACSENETIIGVKLSRNFGQHNAITAGLNQAKGEWILVMDCDLQDDPAEIPNLYRKALEGWDIVQAAREERQDRWLKKLSSKMFHYVLKKMTDQDYNHQVANFGIYHRKVIDAINSSKEFFRIFSLMVYWVGFKRTTLAVIHNKRDSGSSTYTLSKLVQLAMDSILSYSDKPLRY